MSFPVDKFYVDVDWKEEGDGIGAKQDEQIGHWEGEESGKEEDEESGQEEDEESRQRKESGQEEEEKIGVERVKKRHQTFLIRLKSFFAKRKSKSLLSRVKINVCYPLTLTNFIFVFKQ